MFVAIKDDIKGIGAEHFVRVFDGEKGGDVSQNVRVESTI